MKVNDIRNLFLSLHREIPNDIVTVFDICDKDDLENVKYITCCNTREEYLDSIKANNQSIEHINYDIAFFYKVIKKDMKSYKYWESKSNPLCYCIS